MVLRYHRVQYLYNRNDHRHQLATAAQPLIKFPSPIKLLRLFCFLPRIPSNVIKKEEGRVFSSLLTHDLEEVEPWRMC